MGKFGISDGAVEHAELINKGGGAGVDTDRDAAGTS